MKLTDVLPCRFIIPSSRKTAYLTSTHWCRKASRRQRAIYGTTATVVCLLSGAALANGLDLLKPDSIYGGIGAGMSYLNPKDDASEYQVVDRKDIGAQIYLGLDTSRRSAVEFQYTDLGTAVLSDNASLDYRESSLSGLLFGLPQLGVLLGGHSSDISAKRGLYAFGRAGVGKLSTDATNLIHRQENDYHLLLGAGAELGFTNNLAVRAEYLSYDHDAKYLQLSLLYRLKSHQQSLVTEVPDTQPKAITPVVVDTPPPEVVDECTIDCGKYQGIIEGVNFVTNSAELTPSAKIILNTAAFELLRHPNTNVLINAHTDNRGSALDNLDLSSRRALSTASYLRSKGVEPGRLIPQAFGETAPIAPNATAEGRFRNRRVELKAL